MRSRFWLGVEDPKQRAAMVPPAAVGLVQGDGYLVDASGWEGQVKDHGNLSLIT